MTGPSRGSCPPSFADRPTCPSFPCSPPLTFGSAAPKVPGPRPAFGVPAVRAFPVRIGRVSENGCVRWIQEGNYHPDLRRAATLRRDVVPNVRNSVLSVLLICATTHIDGSPLSLCHGRGPPRSSSARQSESQTMRPARTTRVRAEEARGVISHPWRCPQA